jgi:hypothetical protein
MWTRVSAAADFSMWVAFAVGAIAGAIVMTVVFKWALVVMSAVGGAGLITWALPLEGVGEAAVFVALAMAGIIFQGRALVARE